MAKQKNLNNEVVIKELIDHFEWNNKHLKLDNNESFEYEIKFKLWVEEENNITIVCEVFANGVFDYSFPVGWEYTERGAMRKVKQLMKMVAGSFLLYKSVGEKNKLHAWGWEKRNASDILKDDGEVEREVS